MDKHLTISGNATQKRTFTFDDLRGFEPQVDVQSIDHKREGQAFSLNVLLNKLTFFENAKFLTLKASRDNFSASVPLDLVLGRSWLIYSLNGEPLSTNRGGPVRFFIENSDLCQSSEIDECANVKFVDQIELSSEKGTDTRPESSEDHEKLHMKEH